MVLMVVLTCPTRWLMLLKMGMPTINVFILMMIAWEKITKIVTRNHGGKSVVFEKKLRTNLNNLAEFGWDKFASMYGFKTQYGFSDNQFLLGAPEGFDITIVNLFHKQRCWFIVALTGDVMTIPGLPKAPAALKMDRSWRRNSCWTCSKKISI